MQKEMTKKVSECFAENAAITLLTEGESKRTPEEAGTILLLSGRTQDEEEQIPFTKLQQCSMGY